MRLADIVSPLPQALHDEDGEPCVWNIYVTGDPLDQHVNASRTSFDMEESSTPLFEASELSFGTVKRALSSHLEDILGVDVARAAAANRRRAEQYIFNHAPLYRSVISLRPDSVDRIPEWYTDDRLDSELYKISREIERSHEAHISEIVRSGNIDSESLERAVRNENEIGKSALAKYIVSRRKILDVFDLAIRSRKRDDRGRHVYELESTVHKLIFPLRRESFSEAIAAEVAYKDQNLWIVDERMSYHFYLASDVPFSEMTGVEVEGDQRPDILIFDKAHSFSEEEIRSVVIIEFKRPMRESYGKDENPVDQVLRYVEKIRAGTAKDITGRYIAWRDGMPFYCYVIADITPSLDALCRRRGMLSAPDGEGFYCHVHDYGAYVEVSSYTRVLSEARKRNRVFFEKLGLPP